MTAGLIAAYDALEFFAEATASYSLSDADNGVFYAASLTSYYCPDGINQIPFIDFEVIGNVPPVPGTVTNSVTITVNSVGTWTVNPGFPTSASFSVLVNNFRLYGTGAGWYCTWTGMTVQLNGSTVATPGAGNFTSLNISPIGVPFLGIPPTLGASISPSALVGTPEGPLMGSITPYTHSYSGSASIAGGYHVKELGASSFSAFPVNLNILTGGTTGCPCDPSRLSTISAVDTASGSATAGFNQQTSCVDLGTFPLVIPNSDCSPGSQEIYLVSEDQELWSGEVTLIPNLPKSVNRLAPDYAALIFRGGLPQCTQFYFDTCTDYSTGSAVNTGNVQVTTTPFPRESSFLATVGNTPHIIEAPMALPTLAPYSISASKIFGQTPSQVILTPTDCDDAPGYPIPPVIICAGSVGSGFPTTVDDVTANPQLTPGLYHLSPLARYMNYWSAPHWNYAYWFPPNQSGALQPFEWPVDGNRANPTDYWIPLGSQWLWNPALPAGEARKTRTDLISPPLNPTSTWPGFFGSGNLVSPWGINRFKVQNITLPANVQLTQAETTGWSFTNCTPSFGATAITLTPTGTPTTCTATYDLGEFETDPRMLPLLLASVTTSWSGAGAASAVVNLVGVDGSVMPIAATTRPATKYAGSWGRDFSCGYAVSDTGVDSLANGISATELAAAETTYAFELLPGFTAAQLEIVFTLSNPSDAIALAYPTFNLPTATSASIPEGRFNQTFIFPNGPGVRYGSWDWWNYAGAAWQDPPTVYAVGHTSSALDWLAFKRVALQGTSAESGLDTEIASLYDAVEGQTRALLSADTNSFIAVVNGAPSGVMINRFSEAPPLAAMPGMARDVNLQPTGSYALESWSHAQEGRYLIAPSPVELQTPGGVSWTTLGGPTVPGWSIQRHAHPVDNTENATFLVVSNGTAYATLSPWHGYFCVIAPPGGAAPWNVESDFGELHLAEIDSENIVYKWSPFTVPTWQIVTNVTADGGWSTPRMCLDHRGRIELRAVQANHAYRIWSDDNGATWNPLVSGVLTPELVI